jgi:hypothetical protein
VTDSAKGDGRARGGEDEDLAAWLRKLRNARDQDDSSESLQDKMMYQAIVEQHRAKNAQLLEGAISDDHAWQQMRFRLKREGLLQRSSWKTWVPVSLAAAVLAAVVLPTVLGSGVDVLVTEPQTLRGGGLSIQAPYPLTLAKSIAKDLKALDPSLKLHWFGGVATIDLDLEAGEIAQAEDIIRNKVPGSGVRLNQGFNRLEVSTVK